MIKYYRGFHETKNGNVEIEVNGSKFQGEWIFGNYIYRKRSYIAKHFGRINKKVLTFSVCEEVPRKTDFYGRQIYEGDILRAECFKEIQTFIDHYVVEYDVKNACWVGRNVETKETVEFRFLFDDRITIVGNIYENKVCEFHNEVIDNDEEECYDDYDAHSCSACADYYGICQVCGAVIHGSQADHDIHGY